MSKLITFENMKFGKLTVIEKDGEFILSEMKSQNYWSFHN